jgi:Inosine-uridine preferring nucleoside hydrolase
LPDPAATGTAPDRSLGIALLLEPGLPRLIRQVVIMGGAFEHPGNVTGHAEANIWHDPEAGESAQPPRQKPASSARRVTGAEGSGQGPLAQRRVAGRDRPSHTTRMCDYC